MKNSTKCYRGAKRLAFTLAEVLITLAIIGVVAALTIPTVMANYQKRAQYTAFLKVYNTLQNMFSLTMAENGAPNTWSNEGNRAILDRYIFPYLKIANICDDSEGNACSLPYKIDTLKSGLLGDDITTSDIEMDSNVAQLQDGSLIYFSASHDGIQIEFDTNGVKGPNVLGRDVFMTVYRPADGKWGFNSYGELDAQNCDPNSSAEGGFGTGCAARLIVEGKMDY